MSSAIEIFKDNNNEVELQVQFDNETVWLTQTQMVKLFKSSKANISEHIKHILKVGELTKDATVRKFRTVQFEGSRKVNRNLDHYNLDMIISVGYRVNTERGIQFRQWATKRLNEYLVQGIAINKKRLEQTQKEVQVLKTGIQILNRAIVNEIEKQERDFLTHFSQGLSLLDDYDHETLDEKGETFGNISYPGKDDYMDLINEMYSDFESDVFAQPKDDSFESSINQIKQSFGGTELYPSLEKKSAMLLYLIVKNHSFVDGNKRIAAACFLFFLEQNSFLIKENGEPLINNSTLAAMTLFIATSKPEEKETVIKLVISILNRSKSDEL